MPEFTAPGIGRESTKVEIDLEVPANASGALYALGGAGGRLPLYMDKGHLVYLYKSSSSTRPEAHRRFPPASTKIEVVTDIAGPG